MKRRRRAYALHGLALTTWACGGDPAGPARVDVAQLSDIQPPRAFLGRTVNVTITGATTHFAGQPKISFADPAITVDRVEIVSPTALRATLKIGDAAKSGPHDLTVETPAQGDVIPKETATALGAFTVLPSLKHEMAGTGVRGGVIDFDVVNLDDENPFTGPAPNFTAGGVIVRYTEISPKRIKGVALVDALAPVGPLQFRLVSENARGEATSFVTGVNDAFAPTIAEGAAAHAIAAGVSEPDAIAAPRATNLYRVSGVSGTARVYFATLGSVGASLRTTSGTRLVGAIAPTSGRFGEGTMFDTTFNPVLGSRVAAGVLLAGGDLFVDVLASDLTGGPSEFNYTMRFVVADGSPFSMLEESATPDSPGAPLASFELASPMYATDGAIDHADDADYVLFTPKVAGRVVANAAAKPNVQTPLQVSIFGRDPGSTSCSAYLAGGRGTRQAEFQAEADVTYCVRVNATSSVTVAYDLVITPEL